MSESSPPTSRLVLWPLVMALASLSACASLLAPSVFYEDGHGPMAPSDVVTVFVEDDVEHQPEDSTVIPNGATPEGYVVVAQATSQYLDDPEDAVALLRDQARSVGADAIVVTKNRREYRESIQGAGTRLIATALYLRRTGAR